MLTGASFFPGHPGWHSFAIFFSLIPFLYFLDKNSKKTRMFGSFVWGLIVQGIALFWMTSVTELGWAALTCYHALYVVFFGGMWGRLKSDVLRMLLWVALEWGRQSFYCGSPWGQLAQGLAPWPILIQLASLGGVLLVSFWVLGVNIFLLRVTQNPAYFLKTKMGMGVWIVMVFPWVFGALRLAQNDTQNISLFRVAVVQPNILPDFKWSPKSEKDQLDCMEQWSRQFSKGAIDVLIWPETAFLDDPRVNPHAYARFRTLCADLNCLLMIGAYDYLRVPGGNFNAVFLLDSGKSPIAVTHKINLLPFGEIIPFEKHFPFLRHLTPIEQSFQRGDSLPGFSFSEKVRCVPLICFEDTLSSFVRECVKNGADFLVTLTNDGWFRGPWGPMSHDCVARFRAVENRIPLIRCANTGVSSWVDALGREIQKISVSGKCVEIAGVMLCDVPVGQKMSTVFGGVGYAWIFWVWLGLVLVRSLRARIMSSVVSPCACRDT
jgi:apolipoprotein N-acyltransferase